MKKKKKKMMMMMMQKCSDPLFAHESSVSTAKFLERKCSYERAFNGKGLKTFRVTRINQRTPQVLWWKSLVSKRFWIKQESDEVNSFIYLYCSFLHASTLYLVCKQLFVLKLILWIIKQYQNLLPMLLMQNFNRLFSNIFHIRCNHFNVRTCYSDFQLQKMNNWKPN
jgi:hypothetical protein